MFELLFVFRIDYKVGLNIFSVADALIHSQHDFFFFLRINNLVDLESTVNCKIPFCDL